MDAETYADMLPWLVFFVVDRRTGLGVDWGGACAAASALALVVWAYWHGRRAPAAVLACAVFFGCGAAAFVVPSWDASVTAPRAVTLVVLGLFALTSLAFTPLSEHYAAPQVAPPLRQHPAFARVNVQITIAWGVGALAVGASVGGSALEHDTVAFTFFSWVVPLAVAVATVLWVARRWETFCLAHESAVAGELDGGNTGIDRKAVLGAWIHPDDAVVRRLPLRGPGGS